MWWMAVAGAAINQISSGIQSAEAQKELREQQAREQKAFNYQMEYQNAAFNLQRNAALDRLAAQKNRLAETLGADVAGFNLGLAAQSLASQDAQIALADSAGMERAAAGASGTRGNGSAELRIGYQERALSRQLEIQRSQKSLDAQNLARQYSGEFDDIGRELDSWTSTGYRARGQALENQYARRMHELQMGQYDQAISDAQFTFGDFLYAGLTGAAQGMGFAAQINGLKEQSQSVKRGGGQPAPATDKTGGAIRYYDELYKR